MYFVICFKLMFMKILFLTGLISLGSLAQTSDSWKIILNNKEIVYSNLSNEARHTRSVSKAEIKKNGFFEIIYFTHNAHYNWYKRLLLFDENHNQVHTIGFNKSTRLANSFLKSLFSKTKRLVFYALVEPSDINKTHLIEQKRTHLCTLVLTE